MRKVILLGKLQSNLDKGRAQITVPDIEFIACTSLASLQDALTKPGVDTVITGAGLDLEVRLAAIQMIYQASDSVSVHMKDYATGPEGFGPFANRVLSDNH
jgi:hypothetical protein